MQKNNSKPKVDIVLSGMKLIDTKTTASKYTDAVVLWFVSISNKYEVEVQLRRDLVTGSIDSATGRVSLRVDKSFYTQLSPIEYGKPKLGVSWSAKGTEDPDVAVAYAELLGLSARVAKQLTSQIK